MNPDAKAPNSLFDSKEVISPNGIPVRRDILRFTVPVWLPERRMFLYIEAKQLAASDYILFAAVKTWNEDNLVGYYPANLADFSAGTLKPNQSVISLFTAGGGPVGDSMLVQLAQPFVAGVTTVIVQPLRCNAEITHVSLDIEAITGQIDGFRAYLGVLSTRL